MILEKEEGVREAESLLAEVRAAGFAVTPANGRATTIPGLTYQFMSRPKISRTSGYENLFPSASAKYSLGENLQAQVNEARAAGGGGGAICATVIA